MSLLDEPARRHSGRDHQAKRIKRRKKTEAEREAQRAKRAAKREADRAKRAAMREADRAVIAKAQNPNQVLTFRQWCLLAGFSVDTGRRVIKAGKGPIITYLSKRRRGITVANYLAWLALSTHGAA
jgi:hypothetical protein